MSDESQKWTSPTGATIACRETDSDAVQITKNAENVSKLDLSNMDDARQRALDAFGYIVMEIQHYVPDSHLSTFRMESDILYSYLTQPAPVVQGWMPIETAPEGKNILVWYKGGVEVAWRYGEAWQIDTKRIDAPTHWMPLPPAPVEKE